MIIARKTLFTGCLFSALGFGACGQASPRVEAKQENNAPSITNTVADTHADSTAILQAFEQLKANQAFLKELALEKDQQFSWNEDRYRIIRGDMDGDGTSDALLGFIVEGRGGGNNSDIHYAAFLKKNDQWVYQSQFDANAGFPDLFYGFKEIKNGMITGAIMDSKEVQPDIPVTFIYKNKSFINTYTALHKTDNEERAFLKIENIITPTGKLIFTTGTLQTYEQALGKGRISTPVEQPECGTYFEEGAYSEWYYEHNLRMELSDNKKAAWRSVFMRGTDYTINTDKGTITANTTSEELKSIFYKADNWQIDEEEGGGKTFRIPDGPESDNQLHISFGKDGKLEGVYLWIPC